MLILGVEAMGQGCVHAPRLSSAGGIAHRNLHGDPVFSGLHWCVLTLLSAFKNPSLAVYLFFFPPLISVPVLKQCRISFQCVEIKLLFGLQETLHTGEGCAPP